MAQELFKVFLECSVACSTSYLQQEKGGMSGTVVLGFADVGVAPLALSQLPVRGGGRRHLKAVFIQSSA